MLLPAVLLLLSACTGAGDGPVATPADPPQPLPGGPEPPRPAKAAHPAYTMFLLKIDALHAQLRERQAEGEIAALAFPAEQIARHGRLLLTMTTELPEEARIELRRSSATLDALAAQIAEAAARGDAARTEALIAQYRLPLADLDRYRP